MVHDVPLASQQDVETPVTPSRPLGSEDFQLLPELHWLGTAGAVVVRRRREPDDAAGRFFIANTARS